MMIIRNATLSDLDRISEIESECFSKAEAATKKDFRNRLEHYPNHFWLIVENGMTIAFINGMTTDERNLKDEMYEDASMHDENGSWQMIFGVDTIPSERHKGYGGKLIEKIISEAEHENCCGVVLTCKESLVPFYSKFGFEDEGLSQSSHGGVKWNQMRITF